jgi:hypothetical protein
VKCRHMWKLQNLYSEILYLSVEFFGENEEGIVMTFYCRRHSQCGFPLGVDPGNFSLSLNFSFILEYLLNYVVLSKWNSRRQFLNRYLLKQFSIT